jgi:hypothetical protein
MAVTHAMRVGTVAGGPRVTAVTVRVPIHPMLPAADVLDVPVVVHHIDSDTTEVLIDGGVVGFIRYDGHHFAALVGASLETALPCGESDLWDQALARLYLASAQPD